MEPAFAVFASPGDYANQRKEIVLQASAPGPAILGGTADRASDLQFLGGFPGRPENMRFGALEQERSRWKSSTKYITNI
jgi:hypothetical protein